MMNGSSAKKEPKISAASSSLRSHRSPSPSPQAPAPTKRYTTRTKTGAVGRRRYDHIDSDDDPSPRAARRSGVGRGRRKIESSESEREEEEEENEEGSTSSASDSSDKENNEESDSGTEEYSADEFPLDEPQPAAKLAIKTRGKRQATRKSPRSPEHNSRGKGKALQRATRNKGMRTVTYEEESDPEEEPAPANVSSRGRVRKISARVRGAMFGD